MTPVRRRRVWVLAAVLAAVFGAIAVGGAAGVVYWWGVGFDEAETLGMATSSTDSAMITSFWVAVAGVIGVTATGTAAVALLVRTLR